MCDGMMKPQDAIVSHINLFHLKLGFSSCLLSPQALWPDKRSCHVIIIKYRAASEVVEDRYDRKVMKMSYQST